VGLTDEMFHTDECSREATEKINISLWKFSEVFNTYITTFPQVKLH